MGQTVFQSLRLTKQEIQDRFLAYLKQREVVKLSSFCTAINLPIQRKKGNGKAYHTARKVDSIVRPLLASPDCRVETGQRTSDWEVRYHLKPPKPPSFPPRPQGQVTVTVDPYLATWRPGQLAEDELEARRLRRERQAAFDAERREEIEAAREWAGKPTAPETSPPSPLSQGELGRALSGGNYQADENTTTTEMETMARKEARTTEACKAALTAVLKQIPYWEDADLMQTRVAEAAGLSTGFFHRHTGERERVKVALQEEKRRRDEAAAKVLETSPPSPLSPLGEGEPEGVLPNGPDRATELEEEVASLEFREADLREDYERQIRELQEQLAATARRNAELEAQSAVLERQAVDPMEALMVRRVELQRQIAAIQTEMERLGNEQLARMEDLRAIAHAMALLEPSPPSPLSQEGEGEPEPEVAA